MLDCRTLDRRLSHIVVFDVSHMQVMDDVKESRARVGQSSFETKRGLSHDLSYVDDNTVDIGGTRYQLANGRVFICRLRPEGNVVRQCANLEIAFADNATMEQDEERIWTKLDEWSLALPELQSVVKINEEKAGSGDMP